MFAAVCVGGGEGGRILLCHDQILKWEVNKHWECHKIGETDSSWTTHKWELKRAFVKFVGGIGDEIVRAAFRSTVTFHIAHFC